MISDKTEENENNQEKKESEPAEKTESNDSNGNNASSADEEVSEKYRFHPEKTGSIVEDTDEIKIPAEIENISENNEFANASAQKLDNIDALDKENESLWYEAIEENTLPGFQIETVHQFRSFIRVGAQILYDEGELDPDTPLTEDQKALVADLGQFIHAYGSYERWKNEKNKLIKEHNEAVNDLKVFYKKHQDQKRRLELTLQENAKLLEEFEDFRESMKNFDDMQSRNEYLESEIKKFNALLGFSNLDITEEFKKRIADTKTLDISARFLHKAWKKLKLVLSPDKLVVTEVLKKLGEILNKPFNAGKLRLQLMEFVKELEKESAEKKERYIQLCDRSFSNPLNNKEVKDFIELSQYFTLLINLLKRLSKIIENSRG